MKRFIFTDVEHLTDRYHSGGGLVVIAKDIEQVKGLISFDKNIVLTQKDISKASVYPLKGKQEPRMYIFEDAGCC